MGSRQTPSPDRIYSTVVAILQRRYNVHIDYELIKKGA